MRTNKYTAIDFLVGAACGGLGEISKTAVNIVFVFCSIVVVVSILKGAKISEIFGNDQNKVSPKILAVRLIVLFMGWFIGHGIMKSVFIIFT